MAYSRWYFVIFAGALAALATVSACGGGSIRIYEDPPAVARHRCEYRTTSADGAVTSETSVSDCRREGDRLVCVETVVASAPATPAGEPSTNVERVGDDGLWSAESHGGGDTWRDEPPVLRVPATFVEGQRWGGPSDMVITDKDGKVERFTRDIQREVHASDRCARGFVVRSRITSKDSLRTGDALYCEGDDTPREWSHELTRNGAHESTMTMTCRPE